MVTMVTRQHGNNTASADAPADRNMVTMVTRQHGNMLLRRVSAEDAREKVTKAKAKAI